MSETDNDRGMGGELPKTHLPWWRLLLRILWPFLAWLGLLFVTADIGSTPDPPGGENVDGMLLLLLLLPLCAVTWLGCCVWAVVQVAGRLRSPWAVPVAALLFVVLLPLPLLDQTLCEKEFDSVCRSLKTEIADLPDARSRFYDAAEDKTRTSRHCRLPWMRITVGEERLLDHATGQVLASSQWAMYGGGWLARIFFPERGDSETMFTRGFCYSKPDDLKEQLRLLGIREYAEPLPQHPVYPSDEAMLEHFQANRAAFEELAQYYRARLFAGREYAGQGYPFKQRSKDEPPEPGDPGMDALLRRAGAARVEAYGASWQHWLPDPYNPKTARWNDARLDKCRREHPKWPAKDRCWYTGPEYTALLIFPEAGGEYEKSWLHIPLAPKIEHGVLLGPVNRDGMPTSATFLLDSLNLTPPHWRQGECVYRAIDAQWFLRMCRPSR